MWWTFHDSALTMRTFLWANAWRFHNLFYWSFRLVNDFVCFIFVLATKNFCELFIHISVLLVVGVIAIDFSVTGIHYFRRILYLIEHWHWLDHITSFRAFLQCWYHIYDGDDQLKLCILETHSERDLRFLLLFFSSSSSSFVCAWH